MEIPLLTLGESKVYSTLVKIGETSIGNLIKFSGVSHSKIYDILKRLAEKGLVSSFTKNGKQYFSAANPKILLSLIEDEEEIIKKNKEQLNKIIPILEQEQNSIRIESSLNAFEGFKGMKLLLEGVLTEKNDEILILGTPKKLIELSGGYLKDWQKRRIKQGVLCKILSDFDAPSWNEDWWIKSKKDKLTITKRFSSVSPAYLVITKHSVITIYFANNILSFKVSHEDIAKRYKTFFNEFWKAN